jgi:hypothetical protein
VRVPAPRSGGALWIGARHDELAGHIWVGPVDEGQHHRLELTPRSALVVRVRTPRGEPVALLPVHIAGQSGDIGVTLAIAETGPDGLAEFVDVRDLSGWSSGSSFDVVVRPAIPMQEPPQVAVNLARPPDEPVDIVLPATGSLRIRALTVDGASFDGDVRVELDLADGRKHRDAARRIVRVGTGGGVVFPRVGVGTELVVVATEVDGRGAPARRLVAGPARPGEEAVVDLVLGAERVVVTGRLVDRFGEAVADTQVRIRVPHVIGASASGSRGRTDSEGHFRIELEHAAAELGDRTLAIGIWRETGVVTGDLAVAERALPPVLAAGAIALGDVAMAGSAAIASGRILYADGTPLESALVMVQSVRGAEVAMRHDLVTSTDEAGRFEIRGHAEPGERFTLGVDGLWDVVPEPIQFEAGATALHVTAIRGGAIRGSVKLPDGVAREDVLVIVTGVPAERPTQFEPAGADSAIGVLGDDGSFEVTGLVTGSATVSVTIDERRAAIVTISDVPVTAGLKTDDPRLRAIDIGDAVARRTIDVQDETGRPVPNAGVYVRSPGARGEWRLVHPDARGRAEFVTAKGEIDVIARAEGFRSGTATTASGSAIVRLGRVAPVPVTIELSSDADTEARFSLTDLGWYAVRLRVTSGVDASRTVVESDGCEPFRIAPGDDARTIVVHVPSRSLGDE